MDRRRFLAATAATAAAATATATHSKAAVTAPNERLRVGFVGGAGRAGSLLKIFSAQKDVDVRMIADIDEGRLATAVKTAEAISGRRPQGVGDFRRVVDNKELDVMVVGTPDHWHAIPTIMGCISGKDVYVEKPDGHNILEGRTMVAAQRKYQRVVQLGTQARTSPHFQEAIDYIRKGNLGKVLVAKAWESSRQGSIGRPADSDPPKGVNYDMWLGPAPKRRFNVRRFHGNWRWFFDYGTGDLGNDGVHRLDVARWALSTAVEAQGGQPLHMPSQVSALGGKWYFDDMQQWPDTLQVNYQFAGDGDGPGKILTYEMRVWTPYNYNGEGEGVVVYGDRGYIIIGNRRWRAFGPKHTLLKEGSGTNDGTAHVRNFLECVRTRKKSNADLETVGHPSSVLCHAGNVAWRVGRQLTLDPKTELFVGDQQANRYRTRPEYRKPWTLPEV